MIILTLHAQSLWATTFCDKLYDHIVECLATAFPGQAVHNRESATPPLTSGSELDVVIVAETGVTADNLHRLQVVLLQRFPSLRNKAWDLHLYLGTEKLVHLPFRPSCLE